MPEKPLLLPSAKSGVIVPHSHPRHVHYVRYAAIAVGILCVLVGLADLTTRLANSVGDDAGFLAFAPAAALNTPLAPTSTPGTIIPARLRVPSIGVDAKVVATGLKDDGSMDTPKDFRDISWYSPGAKPGADGSAVFAGHVNNALTSAGVFQHLSQVKQGDYVTLADAAGKTKVYRVSSVTEYPADAATDQLFATSGPEQIVLITCDGEWVPKAHTFDKRLVVVAKPAY